MISNEILSHRLKKLRTEKKITQKKLAEILDVSQTTINAWESGRQEPSLGKIFLLSKLFNITPDYLYGFDNETKKYLNFIKSEKYLLSEDSPLTEEDKLQISDIFAEINSNMKKLNKTQNDNHLHFTLFLEEDLDNVILKYKKHRDFLLNINYKQTENHDIINNNIIEQSTDIIKLTTLEPEVSTLIRKIIKMNDIQKAQTINFVGALTMFDD